MATTSDFVPRPKSLGVLPRRLHVRSHLDAAAALELAVLGAAACRLTSLDRLVETVWCLTGGGWRPPTEVVYRTLDDAVHRETVHAAESWVRSIPFFYMTTPHGAAEFRRLMRRPLPDRDDPITRASAAVKFGLLDLADAEDVTPVIADLRRFYLDCRAELETRRGWLAPERQLLHHTLTDRIAWVDTRIAALDRVADRA